MPVSYTHLDVYKRQQLLREAFLRDALVLAQVNEVFGEAHMRSLLRVRLHDTRNAARPRRRFACPYDAGAGAPVPPTWARVLELFAHAQVA